MGIEGPADRVPIIISAMNQPLRQGGDKIYQQFYRLSGCPISCIVVNNMSNRMPA